MLTALDIELLLILRVVVTNSCIRVIRRMFRGFRAVGRWLPLSFGTSQIIHIRNYPKRFNLCQQLINIEFIPPYAYKYRDQFASGSHVP
ncbi:hypothetical protein KGM_209229 [Danaus plexippus plexippus]|uniref:Secreted protein n=1 Tax=Danaus plexippus plexippus TaxID=278856 RepID=A0A212F8A1_DANPL|nr:hypothetical protein KGM_209229 [Danaus plexippus plexippus]